MHAGPAGSLIVPEPEDPRRARTAKRAGRLAALAVPVLAVVDGGWPAGWVEWAVLVVGTLAAYVVAWLAVRVASASWQVLRVRR